MQFNKISMDVNKKLTLFIGKSRKSTPILGILQEKIFNSSLSAIKGQRFYHFAPYRDNWHDSCYK